MRQARQAGRTTKMADLALNEELEVVPVGRAVIRSV